VLSGMGKVEPVKLGTIQKELEKCSLFKFEGSEDCFKKIADEYICKATYNFGEKIITERGGLDSALKNFQLPKDRNRSLDATNKSGLLFKSNPLFVVLDGYAEIYRSTHKKSLLPFYLETIPTVVAGPGDSFGEFEMSNIVKEDAYKESWQDYVGRVTAGFQTVHINTVLNNSDVRRILEIEDTPKEKSNHPSELAKILRSTFHSWGFKLKVDLAVIPRHIISTLIDTSGSFAKNYFSIKESHLQTLLMINPFEQKEAWRDENVPLHFATTIIPKLKNGELPILIPCSQYSPLDDWWEKLHHKLSKDKYIKLKNLTLPYYFFLPAYGEKGKIAFQNAKDGDAFPPILSSAMISSLTKGAGVSRSTITSKFLVQIKNKAKSKGIDFFLSKFKSRHIKNRQRNDLNKLFGQEIANSLNIKDFRPPSGRLLCLEKFS